MPLETSNVDRYANIPTGEEDLKDDPIPKLPTKNIQRRPPPSANNAQNPRKPPPQSLNKFNKMQTQRKQVVYEEDPF